MNIKINVTKPIAIPSGKANPRTIDLKVGVHEVDESILEHWFVKSAIARGVVSLVKRNKNIAYRTQAQIDEANAKKILGTASVTELKPTPKEQKSLDDLVKATADDKPVVTEVKPSEPVPTKKAKEAKEATTKIRKRK